ncbi:MAG: hypothetical protein V2I33_18910, partial [Kangiellaceae bacterium]|nr:hypothetical protein [Kangiellaceae bacterium]
MAENQTKVGIDQGEEIKYQVRKYLQFWYLFVVGIILALTAALLYLRYTPKLYKANAKIKILNKAKGIELPSSAFIFNRSNINLENEMEIIKSYRIMENVVDSLDLTMQFFEEGNVLTTELNHLPFNITRKVPHHEIAN